MPAFRVNSILFGAFLASCQSENRSAQPLAIDEELTRSFHFIEDRCDTTSYQFVDSLNTRLDRSQTLAVPDVYHSQPPFSGFKRICLSKQQKVRILRTPIYPETVVASRAHDPSGSSELRRSFVPRSSLLVPFVRSGTLRSITPSSGSVPDLKPLHESHESSPSRAQAQAPTPPPARTSTTQARSGRQRSEATGGRPTRKPAQRSGKQSPRATQTPSRVTAQDRSRSLPAPSGC